MKQISQAYIYFADDDGNIVSEKIQIPFLLPPGSKLPAIFARDLPEYGIKVEITKEAADETN
jgi:hypothetical protein